MGIQRARVGPMSIVRIDWLCKKNSKQKQHTRNAGNCGEALESDREVVTSTYGYAIGNGAGDSLQIGDGDPLTLVGEESKFFTLGATGGIGRSF